MKKHQFRVTYDSFDKTTKEIANLSFELIDNGPNGFNISVGKFEKVSEIIWPMVVLLSIYALVCTYETYNKVCSLSLTHSIAFKTAQIPMLVCTNIYLYQFGMNFMVMMCSMFLAIDMFLDCLLICALQYCRSKVHWNEFCKFLLLNTVLGTGMVLITLNGRYFSGAFCLCYISIALDYRYSQFPSYSWKCL